MQIRKDTLFSQLEPNEMVFKFRDRFASRGASNTEEAGALASRTQRKIPSAFLAHTPFPSFVVVVSRSRSPFYCRGHRLSVCLCVCLPGNGDAHEKKKQQKHR